MLYRGLERDRLRLGVAAAALLGAAQPAYATDKEISPNDLLNLSLEQLSNVEVTSVSKRKEKVSAAAAAIYVISQDDLRRSGATTIPDALRMVPGLSVAQSGSHSWAISSRGFNGQFANKLLVLIDGRSVYTPLFSGVYWEVQDMPLGDIERIEVIRGPGATLWGANAVNGVINIITKSAKDTQGTMLSQTVGNIERSLTTARHGGKMGENVYGRVYTKFDERDEFRTLTDVGARDQWNKLQGGFRVDGQEDATSFTLQGDMYSTGQRYPMSRPVLGAALVNTTLERESASGGNMLARVNHTQSADSNWSLQMYYDNVQRRNFVFDDNRNTLDVEFQHDWKVAQRHELVWGAGYRLVADNITGTQLLNFVPANRRSGLFNAFAQDEISLLPNEVKLTLGSKFEYNDYTGVQVQPSARLTWIIDERQTWWASASHAVRTPNRFSDDGVIVLATQSLGGGNYAFIQSAGNHNLSAEKQNSYETGYRVQALKNLSFDATAFYSLFGKLVTNQLGSPVAYTFPGGGIAPYTIIPVTPINANSSHSHGVELAARWEPTNFWKLDFTYSYLDIKRQRRDQPGFSVSNSSPPQQAGVRSTLLLPNNVELSNNVYYVDELKNQRIPDYVRVDARVAWSPMPGLELSVVGQNLFDSEHPEFTGFVYQARAQVPRSVYGNVTWKF
ncbi:MAG: TonB-dependent receptor [Proteobacteria bacterium]|nr:TonB-dependent receptor [Pseudomonadota bacterium]